MKLLHTLLSFVTLVAVLFSAYIALAEIDLSGLNEEELLSLRDQIDSRLADIQTATSEVSSTFSENEVSINETTIVDAFECYIKEVNWYSSKDFDFDLVKKEKGFEYIVIVLSEKNTTDKTANAPMFNVLSADNQQCNTIPVLCLYKNQYKINFGATMANTTSSAYFIYKIPAGSKSFKLQILSNKLGADSKYIVFDRDDIK